MADRQDKQDKSEGRPGFWRRMTRAFEDFAYAMEANDIDILNRRVQILEGRIAEMNGNLGQEDRNRSVLDNFSKF